MAVDPIHDDVQTTYKSGPTPVGKPVPEFGPRTLFRVLLTFAGTSAMIVGAFGAWSRGISGTALTAKAFVRPELASHTAFFESAGAIVIFLALICLLGLGLR